MGKEVSKSGIVTPWKQTQDFKRKVYFSSLQKVYIGYYRKFGKYREGKNKPP